MTSQLQPTGHPDGHDDFGGLHRDLPVLVSRRRALAWLGGIGAAGLLAACGSDDAAAPATTSTAISTSTSAGTVASAASRTAESTVAGASTESSTVESGAGAEIPDETAGPYPADGSNGPNVLGEDRIVRRDITSSVGSSSGTAEGIPATINLTVVDAATGSPVPGAAVYLWHCTADGRYSIYEVIDQNYLRGVQVADAGGVVTFDSIFPGCYRGRWPHCHFEVYDDLDRASSGSAATKTSQLALPQVSCEAVYADSRYGDSSGNLSQLSLTTDGIFRDGWEDQLATVTGANGAGYVVDLLVRI